MSTETLLGMAALISLIPAGVFVLKQGPDARGALMWLLLGVAIAGPVAAALAQVAGGWRTGFATTLWVTVAATLVLYAAVATLTPEAWRLTPLLLPYMFVLSLLALIWHEAAGAPVAENAPEGWLSVHIVISVVTYGMVTMGAVAALAAFLQERALKRKERTALTKLLPSVADADALVLRLLFLGEIVLGLGLATGMATNLVETGRLLQVDHKTILTITAFVVIGALLIAHYRTGVRGRQAARYVLLAYLLLTLGFPGVKFVTDVLIG